MNNQLSNWLNDFIRYAESGVRQRGKKLHQLICNNTFMLNEEGDEFEMEIESSDGTQYYSVSLDAKSSFEMITGHCDCAYAEEYEDSCKHQVAAALCWLDHIMNESKQARVIALEAKPKKKSAAEPGKREPVSYVFKIAGLDYWKYSMYLRNQYYGFQYHARSAPMKKQEEKSIVAVMGKGNYDTSVQYSGKDLLKITCNCGHLTQAYLCDHARDLLEESGRKFGHYYFRQYDDFSPEIKKVLDSYGISADDEIAKQFRFGVDNFGNFSVVESPSGLLRRDDQQMWNQIKSIISSTKKSSAVPEKILDVPVDFTHAGLVLMLGGKHQPRLWVDALVFTEKKGKRSVIKRPMRTPDDLYLFSDFPEQSLRQLETITEAGLLDFLMRRGFGNVMNYANPFNQLFGEAAQLVERRFCEALEAMSEFLASYPHVYKLPANEKFALGNITKISFSPAALQWKFDLREENNFISLHALVVTGDQEIPLAEFKDHYGLLLERSNIFYRIPPVQLHILRLFPKGKLMIQKNAMKDFLERVVLPLSAQYPVAFNGVLQVQGIETAPSPAIYLSELNEQYLLIKPKWKYEQFEISPDDADEPLLISNEVFFRIKRNRGQENELTALLRAQHPMFARQQNGFFYLPFAEAMRKSWFVHFYHHLQEKNIPVYGMNDLKKFRYNTNKGKFSMSASSGIDWFDVKIEVSFGDQVVPLSDLKKAILSKQNYILLGDGSIGMLPEEWIEKYSMMFKMGETKDDNIQLSKFHWTIIDELHQQIDNDALMQELHEKRMRLNNIGNHSEATMPASVNATLRDYQHSGFQWLSLLDHLGWGGCLADDMGLGKTLQTLSFLQHTKEKLKKETHLVVCPTSLIFNWETEIKKFTPSLSYHLHYGTAREFNKKEFNSHDLIITSYGMIRSDIEHFSKFNFGYVVLDESQAIKNPAAQISKAVRLLKARNKIILSGTPVQNNTFDLYSQMNFLNPGMLGSMEFFKTEFATPIDKYGDKEKVSQLRKLTYPFLLRRTKNQVAKDLPDKTETILWCEMNGEQRKVYDSFKDHYRQSIMKRIEKDGMNRSGIYILEGLLKLRQICDSPALLNEEEKFPNTSVKLEELTRELQENTGAHKALVFSQFTSMLALIETELKQRDVQYAYLDGSTAAQKRIEAVNEFQNNSELRIFLISLKAGGLGLNLTAADYVYLIDPWWNPAVEQQAIDRTHRIGQVNKIFAYKMICKETVEEKIMALQQKKKALASDLIADETGFVKKLTKDDVEFLFS